ncbi:hypothetical protein F475_04654 [Pseudomonas sp. URMO17WK12:I6]|jgi:hypothetical protein|nr:hypothetical protein F475_04654 [Pseudomonas sp. URMO17WK12:I6]
MFDKASCLSLLEDDYHQYELGPVAHAPQMALTELRPTADQLDNSVPLPGRITGKEMP